MKVKCSMTKFCKKTCGAKEIHDSRDCEPCPFYTSASVKCQPVEEEKKKPKEKPMKMILFTLGDGHKVYFGSLTGFPDPATNDEETLKMMASSAMDTDDRIVSFKIVDPATSAKAKPKKATQHKRADRDYVYTDKKGYSE